MRTLLLTSLLFLFSGHAFSQEYAWVLETNPDYETSFKSDVIMYGGKLYHMHDSVGYMDVNVYDPATLTWTQKAHYYNSGTTNLQAEIIGEKIYILTETFSGFNMLVFDIGLETLGQAGSSLSTSALSPGWEFLAGDSDDELFLIFQDNGSIFLNRFDGLTSDWTDSEDYSTMLNPSFSAGINNFELYLTNNELYAGASGTDNRIAFASLTDLSSPSYYNTAGSNNGKIYIDGSAAADAIFYLTGDGQNAPNINVRNNTTIMTWQLPLGSTDVAITSGTTPAYDFNVTTSAFDVVNAPSMSFVVSNFIPNGGGTANKFYLYGQELPAPAAWDSIGPKLEAGSPLVVSGSIRASLDLPAQQHMAVKYATNATSGVSVIKVLNRKPFYTAASTIMNGSLCGGHYNEIYPQFEIYDADVEQVRILNITSQFGTITNLSAVGSGLDLATNPAVSKFKIYGTLGFATNDAVIITYTDGWSIITDTLPLFSVTASAPNITFNQTPIVFCDNENMIELENYVSYNGGVFTLNGQQLASSTINGITQAVSNPSGTIYYRVNVDGCFVETGVTFSFATVGTATATTTAATCGASTGSAEILFTPGTSTDVTYEWTTGETTAIINSLPAGAYYYAVTDEYNCHTTGFASVGATGITVTPTITNVSCAGANDGAITLAVAGVPNYTVLWSNGYSTNTISNLAPGNYEVTVNDPSGCQLTYSYTVTGPEPISATLTTLAAPDCGVANGGVAGIYTGGIQPYTYEWLGQGQSTASLANVGRGLYGVKVTDLSGCKDTFYYQLNDYQSVAISDSIIAADCSISNGAILTTLTPTDFGNPPSSISWTNGALYKDNFNLAAGNYTLTVGSVSPFNGNMCYSQKTMTVGTKAPIRQEICLVTVDLATSTNLVVWESVESEIDHYNIYRENAVAGTYMLIDTVDGDGESIFNDVVASPIDRSWRYRISAVNECGIEGPVSNPHKTLHLNSINVLGDGSVDVFWDDYEGATAPEYVVWRMTDQDGWQALTPSVPFGTSFFNDVPPVGSTGLDYYVEMVLGYQCTAEKVQDFNSSRSNKDKGNFLPGHGTDDSSNGLDELNNATITVYPNPFNDYLVVNVANAASDVEVIVYSVDGHAVSSAVLSNGINKLQLGHLEAGMYFIQTGTSGRLAQFIKL